MGPLRETGKRGKSSVSETQAGRTNVDDEGRRPRDSQASGAGGGAGWVGMGAEGCVCKGDGEADQQGIEVKS